MQDLHGLFVYCTGLVRGFSLQNSVYRYSCAYIGIYRTLSLRRVIYGYSDTFVPYRISVSAFWKADLTVWTIVQLSGSAAGPNLIDAKNLSVLFIDETGVVPVSVLKSSVNVPEGD